MEPGFPLDQLNVDIRWRPGDPAADSAFVATSVEWSGLQGFGDTGWHAVADLCHEIRAVAPLSGGTVTVLRSYGGLALVAEWDRRVRGRIAVDWRDPGAKGISALLEKFSAVGQTPMAACRWTGLGIGPGRAAALSTAGLDADQFDAYSKDFCGPFAGAQWYYAAEIVSEWAVTGIPARRAVMYKRRNIQPSDAITDWESLVSAGVPENRVNLYLQLKMSAKEAAEHEAAGPDGGDIDAALEFLIAMRKQDA